MYKPASKAKQINLVNQQLTFKAYQYGTENHDGEVILCLHGYPDNMNSFRYQVDDLVAAGYQVIVPALRGYEPCSIPNDTNYDFSMAALADDVLAWLDQLAIDKVHLVGHDWGASITYMVANLAPQRLRSISTIAVPHPMRFANQGITNVPSQRTKSWYMLFNQIPFLSDYLSQYNNWALLRFLWRKWSPDYTVSEEHWHDLTDTFSQPGVRKAMLSYYRQNIPFATLLGIKKISTNVLHQIHAPNLAITGENDGCIDTRVFDHAVLEKDHPKGVRIERIQAAGHFTHQEKPELVNKLLIDWFKEHS